MNTHRSTPKSTLPSSAVSGSTHVCDTCFKRPGRLVLQFPHGPCGRFREVPRFVFRFYQCPWCLAVNNRGKHYSKRKYVDWKPDSELL
jgi:hypothetical protein